MNAQANTDFSRTTVIRPKSSTRRGDIARPIASIKKEVVNVDADKPYNVLQRLWLKALGTLTARQLI